MNTQDTVTIGPSPLKLFIQSLIGGLAVIGGITAILYSSIGIFVWGLALVGGVAALVVLFGVVMLLTAVIGHRPRVEIAPEGFATRTIFGSRSRSWSDIDGDFVVIKLGFGQKSVAYRLKSEFKKTAGIKPTKLFSGNDEAISGALALAMDELAVLLNHHKASH